MCGKIENIYFQSYRLKCRLCGGMKEKMKNALIIASVASMIDQFNRSNIKLLQGLGYHVDVACNYIEGSTCTKERIADLKRTLKDWEVNYFQIDFARNVTNFKQNRRAYQQLKVLAKKKHYNLVHCHAPIGGVLGRIVFQKERKRGTSVIYTAHGFHFFQGAPLKNWMLYYPVEKFLSRWTDCLITINKEDYKRAKKKFFAKRTEYVPGVGVDTQKFSVPDENLEIKEWKKSMTADSSPVQDYEKVDYLLQECNKEESSYRTIRQEKRKELGFKEDDFVIVSVGELNANKNHRVIIEAVKRLKDKKIKYIICGMGELKEELQEFVKKEKLEGQVFLLGYREDIREILWAGDLFAFPSKREGLGVAAIEAMAAGLPIITSNIHGIKDYSVNGRTGYSCAPENITSFVKAIQRIRDDKKSYAKFHINVKRNHLNMQTIG